MGRWLTRHTRRSVAVHLTDGRSLTGVLEQVAADLVVLRHVKVLDDAGQPVSVDGTVAVPKPRVVFVQVLDGREPS